MPDTLLPAPGYFTDPLRTNGQAKQAQDDLIAFVLERLGNEDGALDLGGREIINLGAINGVNTFTGNRLAFKISGTFSKSTLPPHVTHINVYLRGGGGSGGGAGSGTLAGGGGGAGERAMKRIAVSALAASEAVLVASGASGVTNAGPNNGSAGGVTSFGSHVSVNGGLGGAHGAAGGQGGRGGSGGAGGDLHFEGAPGFNGADASANGHYPHGGAGEGAGGYGNNGSADPNSGGGGGGGFATTAGTTGSGGSGLVIVEW